MLGKQKQIPLYSQLTKALKKYIESNLDFGDKLPSEKEIGEMYSVSRTTVRLAMEELEKCGMIYRLQGKGSFVSDFSSNSLNSFNLIDERTFFTTEYKTESSFKKSLYGLTSILPNNIQEVFNEIEFIRIQYIICLENIPVLLVDYYLNQNIFNDISYENLEKEFIDKICQNKNIVLKRITEDYNIVLSYQELSDKLNLNNNTPLLCINKNFYDINNELIIIVSKHIVTERFKYKNFLEI
ncbi:GntR family transcriptional regulator [Fusobacterium sp.]|uniref:GntR family transcriptional regulator n=1 Tax=Fusobacterium sp. TaxID=68766 RepID=UPI0025BEB4D3|nr:GntR family transcriptional regulator [Fusobacterium sp.]